MESAASWSVSVAQLSLWPTQRVFDQMWEERAH